MLFLRPFLITFLFSLFISLNLYSNESDCYFELYEPPKALKDSIESNLDAAVQGKKIHELAQKNIDTLGCKRLFLYQGVLQPVDSFQKRDGEKLRPILVEYPDSLAALNRYQSNRSSVQKVAYIGTSGVALILASLFLKEDLGQVGAFQLSDIFFFTGLGITAGSLGYSFWILSQNEKNLERAVNMYNQKKPHQKIELKFSAGFVF